MLMNTQELSVVLGEIGLVDVKIWSMDEVQYHNIRNRVVDEIGIAGTEIFENSKRADRVMGNAEFALRWGKALNQLDTIWNSPLIIVHEEETTRWCFNLWEVWDPAKDIVNIGDVRPTPAFSTWMEEYILSNERQWNDPPIMVNQIQWHMAGATDFCGTVSFNLMRGDLSKPETLDADGLIFDYGLWIGHSVTPPPDGAPKRELTVDMLTPMHYIEEFMEAVQQPAFNATATFLHRFYKDTEVDAFLDKFHWNHEKDD